MKKNDFIECQFEGDTKRLFAQVNEVAGDSFNCKFVHNGTEYVFSNSGTVISSNGYYRPGAQLRYYITFEPSPVTDSYTPGQFINLKFPDQKSYLGLMLNKDQPVLANDYVIRIQFLHNNEIYDINVYENTVVKSGGMYSQGTSLSEIKPMVITNTYANQANGNSPTVKNISFEPEEVTLNDKIKALFDKFEEKSFRQFQALVQQFTLALEEVSDCFVNYPNERLDPDFDAFVDLLEDGVFKLIDNLIKNVPAIPKLEAIYDFAKKGIDLVKGETEKHAHIRGKIYTQDWISTQRDMLSKFINSRSKADFLNDLKAQYYTYSTKQEKDTFIKGMYDLTEIDAPAKLIEVGVIKLALFEKWINSFYGWPGDDTSGYLHFKYEDTGTQLSIVIGGATVECVNGTQVGHALNHLVNTGVIKELFDIKVVKRVSFKTDTDGSIGGRKYYSGWLDKNNQRIQSPIGSIASELFQRDDWKTFYFNFSV